MADPAPNLLTSEGRLDGLKALRIVLAEAIEADDGRNLAPLARQMREVLKDIDELERASGRKGSFVDELANRRKAGGAGATGVPAAGRRRKDAGA